MTENSSSYLTIILNDNENLKNCLTTYLNVLVVMKATYSDVKTDLSKVINPAEKKQMVDAVSMFRAYATRIKVSINVLKDKFPEEVAKEIDADYKMIKEEPLPIYDACERFVQNINDMLGKQLKVAANFSTQA